MGKWIKESSVHDSEEVKAKKAEENAKIAIAKYNNMPRVAFIISAASIIGIIIICLTIILN